MRLFTKIIMTGLLIVSISLEAKQSIQSFKINTAINNIEVKYEKPSQDGILQKNSETVAVFSVIKDQAELAFNSPEKSIQLTGFPISDVKTADIVLEHARFITDANTQWLRATENGIIPAKGPEMVSYTGTIAGDDTILVIPGDGFSQNEVMESLRYIIPGTTL